MATMLNGNFREALAEHLAALQSRDIERFSATVGLDVTVVDGAGALTRGRESVLRSHAQWFASDDRWTFDFAVVFTREFRGAGLALIEVTYRQSPDAQPARFLLSLVFERTAADRWQFVFDQNTTLADQRE